MDSKIAASCVSEIRKQLVKAEETVQLHYDIEAARCPLCGGTMEVKTHKSEQYFTVYISASIRCSKCGVFGAKVDLQDELSSHCKGYDELTALSRAWSKINQYIKVK